MHDFFHFLFMCCVQKPMLVASLLHSCSCPTYSVLHHGVQIVSALLGPDPRKSGAGRLYKWITITIYIYIYIFIHTYERATDGPSPIKTRVLGWPGHESYVLLWRILISCASRPRCLHSAKWGAWKQGVVIYMMLSTTLIYYTTPIHCTLLPLTPPCNAYPVMLHIAYPGDPVSLELAAVACPADQGGNKCHNPDFLGFSKQSRFWV